MSWRGDKPDWAQNGVLQTTYRDGTIIRTRSHDSEGTDRFRTIELPLDETKAKYSMRALEKGIRVGIIGDLIDLLTEQLNQEK